MEFVQSSFQASFDARVERVNATELAELRTIFRYFDTDGDGAVSSDQACRMFALLGLDVNPAYVKDLEEVYLNEFIKIVDSHVPIPLATATAPESGSVLGGNNGDPGGSPPGPLIPVLQIADPAANQPVPAPGSSDARGTIASIINSDPNNPGDGGGDSAAALVLDEDALRRRNEQIWADEWLLIDSHRRGSVTYDELRLFLLSCASVIPSRDLRRFVEMYGEPLGASGEATGGGGVDEDMFVLTKAGFIKFRSEYTEKDAKDSEQELSSGDEDEEDGEAEGGLMERTARGGDPSEAVDGEPEAAKMSQSQQRRAQNDGIDGDHATDSSRSQSSSLRDGIVVDPGVLDQSDASDLDDDEGDENEAKLPQQSGDDLLFNDANTGEFADD